MSEQDKRQNDGWGPAYFQGWRIPGVEMRVDPITGASTYSANGVLTQALPLAYTTMAANPATLAPDGTPIDSRESEAERRILERGIKVTRNRLVCEMQDIDIERMTKTHAPEVIAERLEMDKETVKTRQKKMRRRKTSP